MPSNIRSFAAATLLFAGQATAHMMLSQPVPFNKGGSLNTSPLAPVKPGSPGSDYPCQQTGGKYDIVEMNTMAVDEPIKLGWSGSAVHNGGTCQIAVTLDKEPDVSSVFKVLQVYEGGCPVAETDDTKSFNFTIPTGFPSGQASLAWVWFNNLGNREVYMNCAPITVTGGAESKDVFNSLPNLYLINLPPSECGSVDSSDVVVPNPGKNVVKAATATPKAPTGPSCAASAAAQTSGLSGYQTSSGGNNGSQTPSSTATDADVTSAPLSYGNGASSLITIATAAPADSTAAATSVPADVPTSYPTLTASSGAGIYGPGTAVGTAAGTGAAPVASGSSASGSTCSTNGALMCNGSTQFGLCNNGNVVWQAVADGTVCSNGQIQKRSDFRHAHVRRHAQNGGFRHGS